MKKKNSAAKKILSIVIGLFILAAVIVTVIYLYNTHKFVYNDNSNANGNTAGNLYNNGLFCELNDYVYFSNPFDSGRLYRMDLDGENVKKLNAETVSSINAYGKYLYFSKNNLTSTSSTAAFRGTLFSAMRSNLKGKDLETLCSDYSGNLSMIGDNVYFQRYINTDNGETIGTLHCVGIDGKNLKEIIKEEINPAGVNGNYIYYAGVEHDHNIYRLNTITNSSSLFFEGNCYMCIPYKEYIYYLDAEDNYILKRISISSPQQPEVVVNKRIATYNMDNNYLYFQIDEPQSGQLCRMKQGGNSNYEVILEGNYDSINVTSTYIYFYKVNEETDAYRIPANGNARVEKLSDVFDMSLYEE